MHLHVVFRVIRRKPLLQRIQDTSGILFKSERSIHSQHSASIQARRVQRGAQKKFTRKNIANACIFQCVVKGPNRSAVLDGIPNRDNACAKAIAEQRDRLSTLRKVVQLLNWRINQNQTTSQILRGEMRA